MAEPDRSESEILLYRTVDGRTRVHVRFDGDTSWLTQAGLAELYRTTPQNITPHIASIYDELLARIRDIRSSEKAFWKKILEIYATSIDYDPGTEASQRFFATV